MAVTPEQLAAMYDEAPRRSRRRNNKAGASRASPPLSNGDEDSDQSDHGIPTPTHRRSPRQSPPQVPAVTANARGPTNFLRPAQDVIQRVQWDAVVPTHLVTVGYEDRFTGIQERAFDDFNWADDLGTLSHMAVAIPRHRIVYFKYRDELMWDRRTRLDYVFGSSDGTKLPEFVTAVDERHHAQLQDDEAGQVDAADNNDRDEDSDANVPTIVANPPPAAAASAAPIAANPTSMRLPMQSQSKEARDRPNYFLCIRVWSTSVRKQAEALQQRVLDNHPELVDCCIPAPALHVTLPTLRLESTSDICRATQVLHNLRYVAMHESTFFAFVGPRFISQESLCFAHALLRDEVGQVLPPHTHLKLKGPALFGSRILHLEFEEDSVAKLQQLHDFLVDRLSSAGVSLVGTRSDYTPHITLINVKRAAARQGASVQAADIAGVEPLKPAAGWGFIKANAIYLCRMTPDRTPDGFYQVATGVPMSARPVVSMDEALDLIQPALRGPTVMVLRGLPGAGKSFLCDRLLQLAATADCTPVICSADHFFEKPDGTYAFSRAQLGEAHSQCKARFQAALAAHEPLVVVDNTNCALDEFAFFLEQAAAHDYAVRVLELACYGSDSVAQFAARNQHNVKVDHYYRMLNRWHNHSEAIVIDTWPYTPPNQQRQADTRLDMTPITDSLGMAQLELHNADAPSYSAVFLTPEAVSALRGACPPLHSQEYYHHMTLCFEPSESHLIALPVGRRVRLRVLGHASDERGQAVAVEVVPGTDEDDTRTAEDDGAPSAPRDTTLQSHNAVAHITLSTAPQVSAAYSNELLQQAQCNLTPLDTSLELEGVVGIGLVSRRVITKAAVYADLLHQGALTPTPPTALTARTTELHLYDFDNTLLLTPGESEGQAAWFRQSCQRHNVRTVVATGRVTSVADNVSQLLAAFEQAPHQLYCQPLEQRSTAQHKWQVVLAELQAHPDIQRVVVFDDDHTVLQALAQHVAHAANGTVPGVARPFQLILRDSNTCWGAVATTPAAHQLTRNDPLGTFIADCGWLVSPDEMNARQAALSWARGVIKAALAQDHANLELLDLVTYGSYRWEVRGDVDACIIVRCSAGNQSPPPRAVLRSVQRELMRRGVADVHFGDSVRCPRLALRLRMPNGFAVELDLTVAVVPSAVDADVDWQTTRNLSRHMRIMDAPSRAALDGVLLSNCSAADFAQFVKAPHVVTASLLALRHLFTLAKLYGKDSGSLKSFHLSLLLRQALLKRQTLLQHHPSLFQSVEALVFATVQDMCAQDPEVMAGQWGPSFNAIHTADVVAAAQLIKTHLKENLYSSDLTLHRAALGAFGNARVAARMQQINRAFTRQTEAAVVSRPFNATDPHALYSVYVPTIHGAAYRFQLEKVLPTELSFFVSAGLSMCICDSSLADRILWASPDSGLVAGQDGEATKPSSQSVPWTDRRLQERVVQLATVDRAALPFAFPAELTPRQRKVVHALASQAGLSSASHEQGSARHIVVTAGDDAS
ncbi:uncharacterized protein MONBRDRAFT_10080 [Monosiga brevicollis MX1]|uniref:R3H domain-containing protein n=1 Tax=Monosiga brevicollis TaxID=81824 RepID=A9V559_MONBE|nr:uncharacterized protein MONBRDRAFT_10080 [Monosiga brevicollis MX1]EDQ87322.1 predicted protein [Monosiga brevicollis MX1]|eukprot:XP_001747935.1 hypothetical protein [Monosiga brevicollis MX1]